MGNHYDVSLRISKSHFASSFVHFGLKLLNCISITVGFKLNSLVFLNLCLLFLIACHTWNNIVQSRYLFSTIINAMSEVLKENDCTPKKKGKGKSAKKFNRNPHNKFQRRFNMGGNGLTAI